MKKIYKYSLLIILVGIISWTIFIFINRERWTLFICETNNYITGCVGKDEQSKDFPSKEDCFSYGESNYSTEGFECGRDCEIGELANICKEICDYSGCS